jgi:hypothetical protein
VSLVRLRVAQKSEKVNVNCWSALQREELTSFSPKENTGTKSAPCRIASLIKPIRRLRVRSAVPGLALRDSAAPPTTIVRAEPGPARRDEVSELEEGVGEMKRDGTLLEDVLTRLHTDGTDAEREDKVAIERDLEVAREGEKMGVQAGEEG